MMEVWEPIPEFPDYSVSSRGLIMNDRTRRYMKQSINQHGIVYVGLVKNGVQYKRAVSVLVANSFLPPKPSRFNTPIHLDGNREHNFVENLVWRPRPFAIAYYKQLRIPYRNRITVPIEDVVTGEYFRNSIEPAMKYGLLEKDVVLSVLNESTPVFPTGQLFRMIEE
jgi:hypothetical protein